MQPSELSLITKRIKYLMEHYFEDGKTMSAYYLCNQLDIPQSSFSDMLSDKYEWKLSYIIKIAKFFTVSIERLLDETDTNLPSKTENIKYNKTMEKEFTNEITPDGVNKLKEIYPDMRISNYIECEAELPEAAKGKIIEEKKKEWNLEIAKANMLLKKEGKDSITIADIVKHIQTDAEYWQRVLNVKISGYGRRSLYSKIMTGKTERQTRADIGKPRNEKLRNPVTLQKAMDMVCCYYLSKSIPSLRDAILKAKYEAGRQILVNGELKWANEEWTEVAGVDFYTLQRTISRKMKMMGMATLHDYMNHYNKYRKCLAYVPGSFTDDIEFNQIYSLDDHKFDIAGTQEHNPVTGKMECKKLYSWFVIEMKTFMVLGYDIKTTPFKARDIELLMARVLKKWGPPKDAVICDNGLASSKLVDKFFVKAGIKLIPQDAYSPTQKANNERIFRFIKDECDNYNDNFVGSNHPVEGRHRGLVLSPEPTTELTSEALKRYENYLQGYYLDKPRALAAKELDPIRDNMKCVSIRQAWDYLNKNYIRTEIDSRQLRYALMEQSTLKSFRSSYLIFKDEYYLEVGKKEINYAFYDPSNKFIVAYDPDDLTKIDLYAAHYMEDAIVGEYKEKGDYVGTLTSLKSKTELEKKQEVAKHNQLINKHMLGLARAFRETKGNMVINEMVDTNGKLVDVRKKQEAAIVSMIKNSTPKDKIDNIIEEIPQPEKKIDINEALSDESFKSLDDIKID